MAATPADGETLDPLRGTYSITNWYDCCRPLFIDLVGDYAGKELFLIEGDSLLRECFEDSRIDFKDGFQLLHAVYVVERFLQDLVKRHCNFHIAFFDENAELCIPRGVHRLRKSRYLLARTVIKRHLSIHLVSAKTHILVGSFPSLESPEFREYLDNNPVHFVMAHDGAKKVGQESTEKSKNDDELAKVLLRGMIWWFNTHKLNVALINFVEFRDAKVFTMIVESFTTRSKLRLAMTAKFIEEIRTCRSEMDLTEDVDDYIFPPNAKFNQWTDELLESTDEDNTSENSYVSLMTAIIMINCAREKGYDILMISALLLQNIMSRHAPLSQRRLPLINFNEEFESKIDIFLAEFSWIARHITEKDTWAAELESVDIDCDIIDVIDGRLFRVILQTIAESKAVLAPSAQKEWESYCKVIKTLANEDISLSLSSKVKISKLIDAPNELETKAVDQGVLPFSSRIFDKHLSCIRVETDTSITTQLGALKLYRETTHWHNIGKSLNVKTQVAAPVSKWHNPLRLNQFYMREMTAYAASLTGSKGKALDAETITVGPKRLLKLEDEKPERPEKNTAKSKKDDVKEPKGPAKKGTKKAAAGLSKKDQIKADNTEKRSSAESSKIFAAWAAVRQDLDATPDNQIRYSRTSAYLENLDSTRAAYLDGEVNTYILHSLIHWWSTYCKADKKNDGYHVVALIWATVRSICTIKSPLTKEIVGHVERVVKLLGITDALTVLSPMGADSKLSFAFIYPASNQNLKIGMTQAEFQLTHCGPYMDRNLDAKPDPRVGFVPDGWQRDVLDQLDSNKSVFVVAPTSAGKTFISFYAMEQVLRADNDGVLVYVAPTKALVNQIAAEIQGRFSKRFALPGKGVWAIHTRDYRVNNSTGCQILVTVPHVLQIMLLSPSNAKSWAPRVRRIIFDEIHSIGQAEDGVVWEQLLLLAPCPIIALSATVGNPEQFNDWLTETQKASGSDLKMIKHSTRYSDLRKYVYQPPSSFKFNGLGKSHGAGLGLDGLDGLQAYHPIASLVDKTRGIPDDLALEPRDCLSLWKAMIRFQSVDYEVPEALDPEKALPPCIRKIDIFKWEKGLKMLLLQWMNDRNSPFEKVVQELSPPESTETLDITIPNGSSASVTTDTDTLDSFDLKATTLPLLLQLHRRRALPGILFNYDRSMCEDIAFTLLDQLVEAEAKWKQGPNWKKLMDGYEKFQLVKDKKAKKPVKPSKKSNADDDEGGSKTDRMREDASEGGSFYDSFDPEAPQEDFSFADPKKLPKSELETHIYQLRRKWIDEKLLALLGRGIGVHHAGMNRKYRQCVEMLFRKGFLRVVIATGTLSLGINMPCATVVFSGDSVFLTALNFRQAAGRSGRRGFDLLGNVVFQGISHERVSRLLSSRLPELTGHFPITTTLVLRLFTLLNDSKNSPYAEKAINALLSQPRLYLGGQSFREQVLHHLRFSIEYLRRNELLGPGGEPVNFTSCVSHLYYTENSSFAFHALLKGGYFHTLCADIDTKADTVMEKLMLVLCHLFCRRPCRNIEDEKEAELIHRSPSMVYLEELPKEASDILADHNKKTLDIFATYVKTFAQQHIKKEDRYLPLTKMPVGADPKESSNAIGMTDLLSSLPSPDARSLFVALSGSGDSFSTIEDLCTSTRDGVFLEAAVVPHLELHPDETRGPLNAYLLDFFKHGSIKPLEDANGIRKSDIWFALNDFSLVLATISTSLAQYLGLGYESDSEMLEVMGSGDAAENDTDEKIAEVTILAEVPSNKFTSPQPPTVIKKKKLAEDWDASEDALAEEDAYHKSQSSKGPVATDSEEFNRLMNVYKAFKKLKADFDGKFKLIWA
ncbi:hypothetical protein B0O99DRAFT_607849 [Bisporella sp. PMI_857]|nr:hypothetical protein B0O99DRAFT_607849 [Bisporella sp. PMI_857]